MCGRIVQFSDLKKITEFFGILHNYFEEKTAFSPRYNIAPTAEVAVVSVGKNVEHQRMLSPMRWGFTTRRNTLVFNARSETVETLPLFSQALRSARCIVPVNGFFEWRREGRARIPFYFSRTDGETLALCAIARRECSGNRVCILTTQANGVMSGIHSRMPVILEQKNIERWMSREPLGAREFSALTIPAENKNLTARLVSLKVNSSDAKNTPELIAPVQFPQVNDLFGDAIV